MTKLKTLKEMNFVQCKNPQEIRKIIKKEAIKWAKDFNEKGHNGMAINYVWNKFFNISKEDLK